MLLLLSVKGSSNPVQIEPHVARYLDEHTGRTRWRKTMFFRTGAVKVNALCRHELSVRQLIAEKFVKRKNKKYIWTTSLDGDPFNLQVSNIQWMSPKEQRAMMRKVTRRSPLIACEQGRYVLRMTIRGRQKVYKGFRYVADLECVATQYAREFIIDELRLDKDAGLLYDSSHSHVPARAVPALSARPGRRSKSASSPKQQTSPALPGSYR